MVVESMEAGAAVSLPRECVTTVHIYVDKKAEATARTRHGYNL